MNSNMTNYQNWKTLITSFTETYQKAIIYNGVLLVLTEDKKCACLCQSNMATHIYSNVTEFLPTTRAIFMLYRKTLNVYYLQLVLLSPSQ